MEIFIGCKIRSFTTKAYSAYIFSKSYDFNQVMKIYLTFLRDQKQVFLPIIL